VCQRSLTEFDVLNVVTALHRIAKRRRDHGGVRERQLLPLVGRAEELSSELQPRRLVSLAWSVSVLRCGHQPLIQALSAAALPNRSGEFGAKGLAGTAWALAARPISDAPLLEALSAASLRSISEFGPRDLASTAWAVAQLRFGHPPLLEAIAASAIPMGHGALSTVAGQ